MVPVIYYKREDVPSNLKTRAELKRAGFVLPTPTERVALLRLTSGAVFLFDESACVRINRKARGEVRRLLQVIGELQELIGAAYGAYWTDRAVDRATKVIEPLEKAHSICLKTTGAYDPVDNA